MVPPLLQYVCPHLSELRGEQCVAQLHKVLAIRSTKKLNLIGHSHGAHAVRYAAGVMPKQIASVLTVGGVNQGRVVASDVMKIANSTGTAELLNVLINTFGNVLLWAQGLDGQTFPYSALEPVIALLWKERPNLTNVLIRDYS